MNMSDNMPMPMKFVVGIMENPAAGLDIDENLAMRKEMVKDMPPASFSHRSRPP